VWPCSHSRTQASGWIQALLDLAQRETLVVDRTRRKQGPRVRGSAVYSSFGQTCVSRTRIDLSAGAFAAVVSHTEPKSEDSGAESRDGEHAVARQLDAALLGALECACKSPGIRGAGEWRCQTITPCCHTPASLSSTLLAWADSDTLCMVEYTHVRLPMLRAFLRRTTPAVIARTAICRAEARIYFEFLDRCPTLIWHTPSGTHSQPASPSLSRPTTSSRVLPHHALSAPVAHSNLTTQPKLHASI
jgi:hypothetical protein